MHRLKLPKEHILKEIDCWGVIKVLENIDTNTIDYVSTHPFLITFALFGATQVLESIKE